MTLQQVLELINPQTARAFVSAARNIIDALLIEAERVREAQAPTLIDYDAAALSRTAPAGGWLATEELRVATQRIGEAIASEKWADGVLFAIRALNALGA
jgi:hypothetical protein